MKKKSSLDHSSLRTGFDYLKLLDIPSRTISNAFWWGKKRTKQQQNHMNFLHIRLLILACKILTVLCFWSSLYFGPKYIIQSTYYTCLHMCLSHTYSFIFATQLCFTKQRYNQQFSIRRTNPFARPSVCPFVVCGPLVFSNFI